MKKKFYQIPGLPFQHSVTGTVADMQGNIIRPWFTSDGIEMVTLNGTDHAVDSFRLSPYGRMKGMEICWRDGNRGNSSPGNLYWNYREVTGPWTYQKPRVKGQLHWKVVEAIRASTADRCVFDCTQEEIEYIRGGHYDRELTYQKGYLVHGLKDACGFKARKLTREEKKDMLAEIGELKGRVLEAQNAVGDQLSEIDAQIQALETLRAKILRDEINIPEEIRKIADRYQVDVAVARGHYYAL